MATVSCPSPSVVAKAVECTEEARAGTLTNMLGESLLDAARFDTVSVRSVEVTGEADSLLVRCTVTVRDQPYEVEFPMQLSSSTGTLVAEGETTLTHAMLGLTPFSAMLGALTVQDEMIMRYRLVARTVGEAGA